MALWAWSEAGGETSSKEGILLGPKLCARPGVFPLGHAPGQADRSLSHWGSGVLLSIFLWYALGTHECKLFWPLTKQSRSVPWVRVRAQSLSCVCLFVTPWTVARQAPRGILLTRVLEWVSISSSRGYSCPRDLIYVSCIGRWILYHWATWEARRYTLEYCKIWDLVLWSMTEKSRNTVSAGR